MAKVRSGPADHCLLPSSGADLLPDRRRGRRCRAWTIREGTKAPQAAGKIHTDFEKGFIRAEIVPFETLKELGSMAACREKGLVRSEGKDYVMKDGDVTLFRFNV